MIWLFEIFGEWRLGKKLTRQNRAVFECSDVGNITDIRLGAFTDNYPYFELHCEIEGMELYASHKVSYMIAAGGISCSMSAGGFRPRRLWNAIPETIRFDTANDGCNMVWMSKKGIGKMLGKAQIEYWITDPRMMFLGLVSLLGDQEKIEPWTKALPSWRQAISILTRFGFYRPFCENPALPDNAYGIMGKFVRAIEDKTPEEFFDGIVPERPIVLAECHVAGTTHIADIEEKTERIAEGTTLMLVRDPGNKYDANAIAIQTAEGERIGWIPQDQNEVLSRLMDAGKLLFAKVKSKGKAGKWVKIDVEVILRDT